MALSNYYKTFSAARPDDNDFEDSSTPLGNFKGFLQPVSGNENLDHFKVDQKITHRLYTPISTKLLYGDIITYSGLEYVVIYSLQEDGVSGISRHKEFLVSRRGEGQ